MKLIYVEEEKCIQCGACVEECPTRVIAMGKEIPIEVKPQACILCGHCVAVCPTEAIDHSKTPRSEQESVKGVPTLDEREMKLLLRKRRSVRNFKDKEVSKESMLKLLDVARLAPTASNSEGISYLVVDKKELISQITKSCIKTIEASPMRYLIEGVVKSYKEEGIDTILRGAPSIVLAVANESLMSARGNAISCLTYLELYAPSLGLGSCWAGILERCIWEEGSALPKLLNIPEGKKVVGAVMVGYPKYSYKRLPDRRPLEVSFLS